jgi:hypothetical protein
MTIIAVVMVVCLAIWIASVYIAARPPRREHAAATTSLGQSPSTTEAPERRAA